MTSDLLTLALLLVTIVAFGLSWVRHRETAHKAFIARRGDFLRCCDQQLQILHHSEQKLMSLLPKASPSIAARLRKVIESLEVTGDQVRRHMGTASKWPVDNYPPAELRRDLDVLVSNFEAIMEQSRDLLRTAEGLAAALEAFVESDAGQAICRPASRA